MNLSVKALPLEEPDLVWTAASNLAASIMDQWTREQDVIAETAAVKEGVPLAAGDHERGPPDAMSQRLISPNGSKA